MDERFKYFGRVKNPALEFLTHKSVSWLSPT